MDGLSTAALTGIFAGLAAVISTAAVERLGGALGGILSTLPFLMLCNSLGLSARLAGLPLRAALFAVPPAFFASALYLLVWRLGPQRMPADWSVNKKFVVTLVLALLTWTVVAVAILLLAGPKESRSLPAMNLMAYGAVFAQLTLGLVICWSVGPPGAARKNTSAKTHALRAFAAFTIGTVAIVLSRVSDTLSGVLVAFPVLFLITNVSVWKSVGPTAVAAAAGPMILGSVAVPTFALVYALMMTRESSSDYDLLDPSTGLPSSPPPPPPGLDNPLHRMNPFLAALATFAIAVVFVSIPGFFYLRWRRSIAAAKAPVPLTPPITEPSSAPTGATSASLTQPPAVSGIASALPDPAAMMAPTTAPHNPADAPQSGSATFSQTQHEAVLARRLHERLVRKALRVAGDAEREIDFDEVLSPASQSAVLQFAADLESANETHASPLPVAS